jgi:toxin ParE1/3/4
MRLIVSKTARTDLRNIANYTLEMWGIARKVEYLAVLRARFSSLLNQPNLGAPRNELSAGYRSVSAGSHVIFYSVRYDAVVILRELHQRMDVKLPL